MDVESTVAELAPQLLRYCVAAAGSPAIGEEVAQEALTALVGHWQRNGPPDSPRAFVYTVARRQARRTRWRRRLFLPLEAATNGHPTTGDTERVVDDKRRLARALEMLRHLGARDREAILLAMDPDLGSEQAADVLGISHSAFKMRVHRARHRLASEMEKTDDLR